MKGLITFILMLTSLSSYSQTSSEICVGYKLERYGYAGTMQYRVHCNNQSFDSKKIMTAFLLPLPYNWTKRAQKYLYQEMDSREYCEVFQLKSSDRKPAHSNYPFHIFIPNYESLNEVCAVSYGNEQTVGLNKKRVYDVIVSCSDYQDSAEFYSAVALDEVEQLMKDRSLDRSISFKTEAIPFYSNQRDTTLQNTRTIIFTR